MVSTHRTLVAAKLDRHIYSMARRTEFKGKTVWRRGTPDSHLRHSGEEGADVVYSPVELQRTLLHVHFEGFVTVEHEDVPDATQGGGCLLNKNTQFRSLLSAQRGTLDRVAWKDSQDDDRGEE